MDIILDVFAEFGDAAGGSLPLWFTMAAGFVGMWAKLTHKNRRDRALDREEVRLERAFWSKAAEIAGEHLENFRSYLYQRFDSLTKEQEDQGIFMIPIRRKNVDLSFSLKELREKFDNESADIFASIRRKLIQWYQDSLIGSIPAETREERLQKMSEGITTRLTNEIYKEVGLHDIVKQFVSQEIQYEAIYQIVASTVDDIMYYEGIHHRRIQNLESESVIINHRPRRKR